MKKINLVWYIFLAVGAFFLILSFVLFKHIFDYSNKIEINGIITSINSEKDTDGDRYHVVYVEYEVNNKKYESKLNGYLSSFEEGKEIKIYYDKDDPSKIGMKSVDYIFLIFPGFGILFTILGGVGLLVSKKQDVNIDKLRSEGICIQANYVETKINNFFTFNGKHPYNIICEFYPLDGKRVIYKSENLWFNPEDVIKEKNITSFPVYISQKNNKKYAMDISMINPKL